jgi:hypothetical protein
MKLRSLALALALCCGFTSTAAFAAKKPGKVKAMKPHKDKRFKDSKAAQVKPRKPGKAAKSAKAAKTKTKSKNKGTSPA